MNWLSETPPKEILNNKPSCGTASRVLDRIKAGELLAREAGGRVPVIGWVEGPLAESCDLAGVNEVLLKVFMEPDFVKRLMAKTLVTAKDFARAQVEAGCSVIGVGEDETAYLRKYLSPA